MSQKKPGDLIKQLSRMRKDLDRVHVELRERYLEASAPEDLVQVTFNGQQELMKISIDPRALTEGKDGKIDLEMLEDLIIVAINNGINKSKALMKEEMNDATGGLADGFPALF